MIPGSWNLFDASIGNRGRRQIHPGLPPGKTQREEGSKYSLAPVAERLSKLLGKKVSLASDCIGEEVAKTDRRDESRGDPPAGKSEVSSGRREE